MLSSRNSVYKPSLDLIFEELSLNSDNHIDKLLLEEYAVITTEDLTNASDIQNSNSDDVSFSHFSKMHNRMKNIFDNSNTEFSLPTTENDINKNHLKPFELTNSEINIDVSLNEITNQSPENLESSSEQGFAIDLKQPVVSDLNGISIDSSIGRKYFTKAIKGKYMNVYYSYTKELITNRSDFYFKNISIMLKILDCDLALTGFEKGSENLLDLVFVLLSQLVIDVTQVHIFSSVASFSYKDIYEYIVLKVQLYLPLLGLIAAIFAAISAKIAKINRSLIAKVERKG